MTTSSSVKPALHSAFPGLGCVIKNRNAMTAVMNQMTCANTVENVGAISTQQMVYLPRLHIQMNTPTRQLVPTLFHNLQTRLLKSQQ